MTPGALGVQRTLEVLSHFPDAAFTLDVRETSVVITPTTADGFAITVYDTGEDAMIAAERWHTHYEDPDEVAWCALWLLTPFYRLVHELKGGVLVACWIERYEATGWEGFEPVYFLNPEDEPSWQPAPGERITRRYMQQAVLPSPQPYEQIAPSAQLDADGLPLEFSNGTHVVEAEAAQGPSLC